MALARRERCSALRSLAVAEIGKHREAPSHRFDRDEL
jgi:hypothetical protein